MNSVFFKDFVFRIHRILKYPWIQMLADWLYSTIEHAVENFAYLADNRSLWFFSLRLNEKPPYYLSKKRPRNLKHRTFFQSHFFQGLKKIRIFFRVFFPEFFYWNFFSRDVCCKSICLCSKFFFWVIRPYICIRPWVAKI